MGKLKNKAVAQWKPVEIAGSFFNGSDDFGGLAGLEVLENYDSSFLLGVKKNKVKILFVLVNSSYTKNIISGLFNK